MTARGDQTAMETKRQGDVITHRFSHRSEFSFLRFVQQFVEPQTLPGHNAEPLGLFWKIGILLFGSRRLRGHDINRLNEAFCVRIGWDTYPIRREAKDPEQ